MPLSAMPIRRKITLINVLISVVTLALAGGAAVGYELMRFREAIVRDITTQAELLAANSAAAMAFGDAKAAREMLRAVEGRSEISWAELRDTQGRTFALYVRRDGPEPMMPEQQLRPREVVFDEEGVTFCQPVRLGKDPVGTLCLRMELQEQSARLQIYGIIASCVMAAALIVSYLISLRLRTIISDPITKLATLARAVREHKDYSLRAVSHSRDEIGALTEDFNQMLAQVESNDQALRRGAAELQASEQRFRQMADAINEVFWMTNLDRSQILYVSPGYHKIWGRNCESLYAAPEDWINSIHPDDRERVSPVSVFRNVAKGQHDEEYRIVRPDGTQRWIRDRAFPVLTPEGRLFRIAGIAEDITERKLMEKQILEISEREQSRIGQDLHDDLCQQLVSAALATNLLCDDMAERGLPEAEQARRIAALLDQSISTARRVSRGLYPVTVETGGLILALQELAVNVVKRAGVDCRLEYDEAVALHEHAVAVHLFRIAQEAVNNAVKHARARKIRIALTRKDLKIQLMVEDDGIGISPDRNNGGMGLHIMKYRASVIGASLQIQPASAGGTLMLCVCAPRGTAESLNRET
jgi:PAS domain S-box-containing protein